MSVPHTLTVANTQNLITLVESADAAGCVCLLARDEKLRTAAQAREWLTIIFMMTPLLTHRLDAVKKAINEIDLSLVATERGTALMLNLAKLLQLPAVTPAQELAEFKEMLLAMRAFLEAHPAERCDIQLCNNRDRNKRVFGTLHCRVQAGEHKMRMAEAANAAFKARLDGSPALTAWLRNVALSLQKRGPWSFVLIREDDLFGICGGPYSAYLRSQPEPMGPYKPLEVFELDV